MSAHRAASLPSRPVLTAAQQSAQIVERNAAEIRFANRVTTTTSRTNACVSPFKTNAIHSRAAVFGSPPDQAKPRSGVDNPVSKLSGLPCIWPRDFSGA